MDLHPDKMRAVQQVMRPQRRRKKPLKQEPGKLMANLAAQMYARRYGGQ